MIGAVKTAKSWRSQTAMVFLSPSTWPALARMRSPWPRSPSASDSSAPPRTG
jgi:hypothetical protein